VVISSSTHSWSRDPKARPLCVYSMNRYTLYHNITIVDRCISMNVGPCHHGMARPQVADGGTASDMEGSCE
jgi:hypothetical protein